MATDKKNKNLSSTDKSTRKLNDIGRDILNSILQNTYKTDTRNKREIERISHTVDTILADEMTDIKSFTSEDISTFLLKTLTENRNSKNGDKTYRALNDKNVSLEDLFNGDDNNDIFTTFNERYKNEALLMEDLDTITSQLIELDEAINTTRDAIVTADDLGSVLSRSLTIDSLSQESEVDEYINLIKDVEDELKLHDKIKNHIVPKTLKYGKYYVYIIPQSKLFQDFQKDKMKKKKIVFESHENQELDEALDIVLEEMKITSVNDEPTKPFGFSKSNNTKPNVHKKELQAYINNLCESIDVNNEDIPIPLLENVGMEAAKEDLKKFSTEFKDAIEKANEKIKEDEKNKNVYASLDGVLGIKDKSQKEKEKKLEDFTFIKDCYIKLLDPKRVIPVRMMEFTIGYYYIYDSVDPVLSKNKNFGSRFTTNFNIQNLTEGTGTKNVLNIIAEKIVKSFDKQYLQTNEKFKDAILNALMYYKQYNKSMHFQFIPADCICEFKINEDENGEGVSMLSKSLFYAKLYLSLLLYSILMYMSKSSDTRIYYVKNSGIDTNYTNKVMELARDIKSKQIKFTDLLSYNSMISKIGAGKEIFMPVGKSGERGIEFDILAGQDIRLQDDLMEMLKQGYINGTGVPSVIMNYINEADYAKTLVMANAKYLSRVLSYQIDFNTGITKMYKMILKCCTSLPPQIINGLEFKFLVPKSLSNTNFADLVQYGDNIIDFITRYKFGENSEQNDFDNKSKDLVREKLAKEVLPFLPWEMIDDVYKEARLEAKRELYNKNNSENMENQ